MRKPALVFVVLLFITQIVCAQQARQYSFIHYSSFNGLSSNIVNNVVQDKKGYIWLATLNGLQRFDGNSFLTFKNIPGDSSSVPGDIIDRIYFDSKARLWAWSSNHIGIFNTSDFKFHEVNIAGNTQEVPFNVQFITENKNGDVVVYVSDHGLYQYSEKADAFSALALLPQLQKSKFALGFYYDVLTDSYFFATPAGLIIYNNKTKNLDESGNNPDKIKLIDNLQNETPLVGMYGIYNGELWYSSWPMTYPKFAQAPYINAYNISTGKLNRYSVGALFNLGYTETGGVLRQRNGKLWFFGHTYIVEYTGESVPFKIIQNEYKDEQSIKFDRVNDMFEDRQNNVWISTDNGEFLFNPDKQVFENYNLIRADGSGVIDGGATVVCQLSNKDIVVGSWGGGLYFYDSSFNPLQLPAALKKYVQPYAPWCMTETADKKLWIGMQGGGLIVYDIIKQTAQELQLPIFANSTIRQVTRDKAGNIWFAQQNGQIVKWDAAESNNDIRKGYKLVKAADGIYIQKLITDNEGNIWAATVKNGTYKFNGSTEKELVHFSISAPGKQKLWGNDNNDIIQYNDSTIIIAGNALNLVNTRTNTVTIFTSKDGLPSNTVKCLKKDKNGILWLGMLHGLCQMNLEKKVFTLYDRRDGLKSDNFDPAGAYDLPDGRIAFTSDHSFSVFNPADISENIVPPQTFITSITVGNKSLPVDSVLRKDYISLSYDNTAISISFSALNYVQQNKLHYHYMLEGVDKTWQESDQFNTAVYNHLSPGTYTFKVKTVSSNGKESKLTTLFDIRINPPFWQSWWFIGLIAFASIILIYWLDKIRMQKIKATESIRTRIATSLTEDMSQSLNSINISSELAKTKIDSDKTRTKDYINHISETSNRMMHSMEDMVWSIDPTNDTLQQTIERMKLFAREMQSMHNIDITFEAEENAMHMQLDMQYRYELLSIYKEAIINAARHSKGKHIHASIFCRKNSLLIIVEDDGRGFDIEAHKLERGLNEMKRRAESVHAKFEISSEINTGTRIKLEITV